MIDIPIGKALIAVEGSICEKCSLYFTTCTDIACIPEKRKDGKRIIFKLVDYPPKEADNAAE